MATVTRSRRLEVRLSEDERKLQEAAAAQLGQTLSEFIRQSALLRAEEVLQDSARLTLSVDAARRFLEVLDEDAVPPEALRDLFRRSTRFTY
jgi:uncharacterized protein (DUF1778 family)